MTEERLRYGPGRVYLSPLVGRGTEAEPFRVKAATVAGVVGCRSVVATFDKGRARGRPVQLWSPCLLHASDWSAVEADPELVLLADLASPLDRPSSAEARERIKRAGAFSAREAAAPQSRRELVRELVRKHYPEKDERELVG